MARFEFFDLDPAPSDGRPAAVTRETRGPGHPVDLDEAATLAELAMSTDDHAMRVLSVAEVEAGWAFGLQTLRYVETRSDSDMAIGHGLTFVDRKTGDVYSSGSGAPVSATVLGFARALAEGTGPAQVPVNEQLRPTIDLYYTRLFRAATAESDQTTRDRLWLHLLDAVRLRRLTMADAPSHDLRQAARAVHDALVEFPLLGARGVQIHSAFATFERAVGAASG
jgi:hypothetical protein